jgi:DNA (cytosine-5)-methyltransferase 1
VRELALFAGAGGGILGGLLLGWRTVCAVEIDAYCRSVLLARQRDGMLQRFPIWDDVCTFDGRPWRGHVDVISGGFPCQDISSAGSRLGLAGKRSGLWSEFARIIGEVRPVHAFVENSPDLTNRGLDVVLGDLASLGYDARWDVLGARHIGAPHRRDRIWIVATDADRSGEREQSEHAEVGWASSPSSDAADAVGIGPQGPVELGSKPRGPRRPEADTKARSRARVSADADSAALRVERGRLGVDSGSREQATRLPRDTGWWSVHRFAGVDDGVASRMDRVKATGNGQVPAVAALAWKALAP